MTLTKHSIDQRQNTNAEMVFLKITTAETSTSATSRSGIAQGSYRATILRNSNGNYTITLNQASRQNVFVVGFGVQLANARMAVVAVTKQTVRVNIEVNGTATNADFWITLAVFDSATER